MTSALPSHVGIILDGNRRWAKEHHVPTLVGHQRGRKVVLDIVDAAFSAGIAVLSLYVFSTENWKREATEVSYLMELAYLMATKDLVRLQKNDVRVVWLGSREGVSNRLCNALDLAVQQTANNGGGILALCFNYGGQQEIATSCRRIIEAGFEAADITPERIGQYLDVPELPVVDLIIRTSGEQRISNFMLWRAAYAELYFVNKHWPDFTPEDLSVALANYGNRQRRFGGS